MGNEDTSKRTAVVIGAGPAGLMAADVLSAAGVHVTLIDQMPTVGRKFLMAGKSGLNLTKMEPDAAFMDAFGTAPPALHAAINDFGPDQVVAWATGLGQPCFTGSTGRVFPVVMKASPLLRAWVSRLTSQGVRTLTRWSWAGWDADALLFQTPQGAQRLQADITILACGGGSWRKLGSDGAWTRHLSQVAPFKPANCGFRVAWSSHMTPFFGQPIKATALLAGHLSSRGEWVVSATGIEGGGIYAVSAAARDGHALCVDLLPDLSAQTVTARFSRAGTGATVTKTLKATFGLSPAKIALFHEMRKADADAARMHPAALLKALPLRHQGPAPLDDAISTAGGLTFDGLDGLMIRARPGTFAAGEMLDWEAPTGGYLITASLATGRAAALAALAYRRAA